MRHRPETIGLQLDEQGWADVHELIQKMNAHDCKLDQAIVEHLVATNSKQRFAFNEDKTRIRANQGHSITVDLQLQPKVPPATLYHGTAETNLPSILESGLQKRERQHVHLSSDINTAKQVGQRHGKPVVLVIDTGKMIAAGHEFYLSENGVWLTGQVPAAFLSLISAANQT